MNSLSGAHHPHPHPRPLCALGAAASAAAEDLPRTCHSRFSAVPRCLSPGPLLGHHPGAHHRPPSKTQRDLSPEEQQELRRKINSRERRRMQDLNVAMDALREVMVPYASSSSSSASSSSPASPSSPSSSSRSSSSSSSSSSHHHHHHHHHQHQHHHPGAPPGRRLSKISTLVLARNYILLLGSSLQEMRRLLGELSVGVGAVSAGPVPRLLLAGGWPLISGPGHLLLSPESLLAAAASSSPSSAPSHSVAAKCTILSPGPVDGPLAPPPVQWGALGPPGEGSLCPCSVCRLPRFGLPPGSVPRFPK